jgi:hypothetical protein
MRIGVAEPAREGQAAIVNLFELRLRLEASGPVPVASAWQRYARPALWPIWSPQLRSVEISGGDSGQELAAGTTGRVHGPVGVWADFTVLSFDAAARSWSWRVRRGPLTVRLEHRVEARADEPGSRTTLVLQGLPPVVLGYAPIAWYALHRLVSLPDQAVGRGH